jgi:uncharacterized NAD-dependent epimerase/dehydratase family protein
MKIPSVVIIDSGVNLRHPDIVNDSVNGFGIDYINGAIQLNQNISDEIGHGTAIYNIIRKSCSSEKIMVIKIFGQDFQIKPDKLYGILNYIYLNVPCDILNLSLGVTDNADMINLYEICHKLINRGTLIISAFDNNGAISYPAEFNSVIGVDTGYQCNNVNEIEYVENSVVNVRAKGNRQRVAWLYPEYIVTEGNSFACAHVTSIIIKAFNEGILHKFDLDHVKEYLKGIAKTILSVKDYPLESVNNNFFLPCKAVIFPFNKETHSLLAYQELINFEISGVADVRFSGNVCRNVSKIINYKKLENDFIVGNIDKLNWNDEFDTIILGHTKALSNLISTDLIEYIINNALEYNKNVISFDNLSEHQINKIRSQNLKYYFPSFSLPHVNKLNFGKLYEISQPVVCVLGTSTKQGKFTIQLELRKMFMEAGYSVGQLGTEPSALLFGMDEVYHFGYGVENSFTCEENIFYINYLINKISQKNPDIIITGGQSASVPYAFSNISFLNTRPFEMLAGTLPDIVILCVNVYDTFEYIDRTIQCIENFCITKVICIVVYPNKKEESVKFNSLDDIKKHFKIPVLVMDQANNTLFNLICDYFQE